MENIEVMFVQDAKLQLSRNDISKAFGMSHMTVVQETNPSCLKYYKFIYYVEFLEMIARIAIILFEGSEMEEKELVWKVEYILSELLG